jgi:hypothetical protein
VGFRWIREGANEGFNLMGDFYQTRKTQKTPLKNLFFLPNLSLFPLVFPQFESAHKTNIPGDSPKCPLSDGVWNVFPNPNPEEH